MLTGESRSSPALHLLKLWQHAELLPYEDKISPAPAYLRNAANSAARQQTSEISGANGVATTSFRKTSPERRSKLQ